MALYLLFNHDKMDFISMLTKSACLLGAYPVAKNNELSGNNMGNGFGESNAWSLIYKRNSNGRDLNPEEQHI